MSPETGCACTRGSFTGRICSGERRRTRALRGIHSDGVAGHLLQAELLTFVARVNPGTKFTPLQLSAIADEVCSPSPLLALRPGATCRFYMHARLVTEGGASSCDPVYSDALHQVWLEYAEHVGPAGLSLAGLCGMYEAGKGSVDDDFAALGLWIDPQPSPEYSDDGIPRPAAPWSEIQNAMGPAALNIVSAGAQSAAAPTKQHAEGASTAEQEREEAGEKPAERLSWAGRLALWGSAAKRPAPVAAAAASSTAAEAAPVPGQLSLAHS